MTARLRNPDPEFIFSAEIVFSFKIWHYFGRKMKQRSTGYKWQVSEEILRQMVEVIRKEADPEMIIMFGSRARGEARDDSDLDLIVIEKEPFGKERSKLKELQKLYMALADFSVPTDILVYSQSDVEKWRGSINNVLARGLREGKVLYERNN